MKILLYTGYRTGSKSLGEWLEIELETEYYHEPFNPTIDLNTKNFNIDSIKSGIIKISQTDGMIFNDIVGKFDKIILLYRENTLEQAESFVWANNKKQYHHTFVGEKFVYAHYNIPDDFLESNKGTINFNKARFDKQNEHILSIQTGLCISYEELYYSETGIKKLEEYLGFKAKTKFNSVNKLRNGFVKKSLT